MVIPMLAAPVNFSISISPSQRRLMGFDCCEDFESGSVSFCQTLRLTRNNAESLLHGPCRVVVGCLLTGNKTAQPSCSPGSKRRSQMEEDPLASSSDEEGLATKSERH
ncbi:uncharacterized protein [Hetaerina americana]|uniref:uncharacterized protein n=1 Tax=Hetaerina americana TaxID=62018 RepID=UPI003A7F3B11